MRGFARRLIVVALLATIPAAPASAAGPGTLVPFFKATDLRGQPVSLGDLVARHRVLILFWDWRRATSARAMQVCDRLQETFGKLGLNVVAVEGEGSSAEQVLERVEKLRSIGNAQRYTIVPDPTGSITRQFGVENTPQLFLLDGAGRVAVHFEGFRAADETVLEERVKQGLGLDKPVPLRSAASAAAPASETETAPQGSPADSRQSMLEKYRYFGNFYLHRGEPAKAEDFYRKYVELAPEDVPVWLQIGEACARQRRYDQAREAWERVLRIDPGNSEADANIRKLIRGEY